MVRLYFCLIFQIYKENNPTFDEGSTSSSSSRLKRYMGDEDESISESGQNCSGSGQRSQDEAER